MKLTIALNLLLLGISPVSGFQQRVASLSSPIIVSSCRGQSEPLFLNDGIEEADSSVFLKRRSFVRNGAGVLLGSSLGLQGLGAQPAMAGLLDEFGSDPTKIDEPKKQARETVKITSKIESDLEPNLRSNYYYPTNKKRYLPRIKKCNDLIPDAANMIGNGDWGAAGEFANKVAEDTILPMKLYTSSLLGGGTNVKVSFAKDMNKAADDFEKAQKQLSKAIAKQDKEKSTKALQDLSQALLSYRTAGKLLGPDGGGDIPSVDDIRRSASRSQKRFEEGVKSRDERIKSTSS
jgi:hypothetical protein